VGDEMGGTAADPLQHGLNNNRPPFYKNALLYYNWLSERIGKNVPLDEVVVELLSATGGTVSNPPVNFLPNRARSASSSPKTSPKCSWACASSVRSATTIPFDRWTMDDYYGFNAFFSQIGRKTTDDPHGGHRLTTARVRRGPPLPHPGQS
jgi:hypothetical protein